MKILFTGGGTGGHIYPIIAIIREIKRAYPKINLQFFYIGPKDDFGQILLSQEGIKVKTIFTGKVRRYFTFSSFFKNIFDIIFNIPLGIIQAYFYIFFSAPDLIFSKGGYGSIPAVLAGWLLKTPILLHESDIVPGLANRFLARFSLEIFVSFPVKDIQYFPLKKMVWVGNPVRQEILEGKSREAMEYLKLIGEKPIVLILGGSQGSQRINDKILEILPELLKKFEVIHQTGDKNFKAIETESQAFIAKDLIKYYHPFPFLREEHLKLAYAACDIVVSRAGSGSIFEIAAIAKPAILIPLPESANSHQVENAYYYAKKGGAIVLEEANFTPHFFLEKLRYLVDYPQELEKMQNAAKEFSKIQSAKIIANYICEYILS